MIFSLGALAFNFIKSTFAADKLSDTVAKQAKKMDFLREKVKSVSDEFKHFNAIQEILGENRGTAAAKALGGRLSALSARDIELGLGDLNIEDLSKEGRFSFSGSSVNQQLALKQKTLSSLDIQKTFRENNITKINDELAKFANSSSQIQEKFASKIARLNQNLVTQKRILGDINAEIAENEKITRISLIADKHKGTVLGQMLEEQQGFTETLLNSSSKLKLYNDALVAVIKDESLLDAAMKEKLANLRARLQLS